MASNSTNERRRTAANTLHISNLPVGFIVDVSAYLSKPSRAILAVAFLLVHLHPLGKMII